MNYAIPYPAADYGGPRGRGTVTCLPLANEASSGYMGGHADGYGDDAALLFVGPESAAPIVGRRAGVRLAAAVSAWHAAGRIAAMARIDILWIWGAEGLDEAMLGQLCAAAARRGCGLVVEVSLAALDRAAAAISFDLRCELLVDASDADRLVALAAVRPERQLAVHDIARDEAAERIDRLQEEVARISRLLSDLAVGRALASSSENDILAFGGPVRSPPRDFSPMPRSFVPEDRAIDRRRAKQVRAALRQRRMREQYFPADLFADPAWDMLLDLYAARLERQPVSVSSLCIAAAVPATTALRWIKTMCEAGLFLREADPQDGRRIFIALADGACEAMARYFDALEE